MREPRQWVLTVDLKATDECEHRSLSPGERISVDIVAETDAVQDAIAMVSEHLKNRGFELLDITNCEILVPRSIKREHHDLVSGIFTASTIARSSDDKVGMSTLVDKHYYSTHPKPWILTAKVKALPSWTGELDDREPVFVVDALVYAVTKNGAQSAVTDGLLERDLEVQEVLRLEIFDEHSSKPTYHSQHFDWGEVEVEKLSQHYDSFLTNKNLTIGDYIWPEDVIEDDSI